MAKKYYLALDLKDDPDLISQYIQYHQRIWPEITESIRESGIDHMEIYHVQDRLFMVIDAEDRFDFDQKAKSDQSNPIVQEWEQLMDQFQKRLPGTPDGGKWVLLSKIFDLKENG